MQYQSFPGVKGGSRSSEKLTALRLPSFAGKRFLDVGCNEGFFCGYAAFDGAEKVVGIDKSGTAIARARQRFPACEFLQQSWEKLPQGPFDVITLLSALHYADDQPALVDRLMERLADDGLLVLEVSIAPNPEDEWIRVERSIDERLFPTRRKLGSILSDYAWKIIGHSVNQAGDPLQRYVVHVRKMKPYAYLLMGTPGSGKSTISRRLFKAAKVPVVSGDRIYLQVSQGKHEVSEGLRETVSEEFTTASIDKLTQRLFAGGFVDEVVALWGKQAGYRDFVLDSFVPPEHRSSVKEALVALGYYPVDITVDNMGKLVPSREAASRAAKYEQYLQDHAPDENERHIAISKMMDKRLAPHIRWHLDSPVEGQWIVDEQVLKVAGWVVGLGEYQQPLQIYIKTPKDYRLYTPEKQRKDVLNAVFGSADEAPEFWQQHPCGFSFTLDVGLLAEGFEIGAVLNEREIPLANVTMALAAGGRKPGLGERFIKRLSGSS